MKQFTTLLKSLRVFLRNKNASRWGRIALAVAVLYLIVPTDLIADFIPIVGLLDDTGVLVAALTTLLTAFRKYKNTQSAA